MKGKRLGLTIAVIVVVAIVLLYVSAKKPKWAHKGFWMAHLFESPDKVYKRSSGTFDEAAQIALRRSTDRSNMQPEDHMLAATIITRNIVGQEHKLGREDQITKEEAERAILRQDMFNQARQHYMAALDGMRAERHQAPPRPETPATPQRQRPRLPATVAAAAAPPRPRTAIGFMVDAALDFAVRGMRTLLDNDPVLRAMAGEEDMMTQIVLLDAPLAQAAQRTRDDIINGRRAAAQTKATPGARADAYVQMATSHTDDPENSHDTAVNGCLRAIVGRLRADQSALRGPLPSLDSIIRDINADGERLSDKRKDKLADVIAVINRAREKSKNIAVDITDEEALQRVWMRAEHPNNKQNREKIRQSVFDNLYDCWKTDIAGRRIVCINGRTSRILSSLVLLDYDERNWIILTMEQVKNDVFQTARAVIDREAKAAANSSDPNIRKVGMIQLASTSEEMLALGPVDDGANAAFVASTKAAIERDVDELIAQMNVHMKGAISPQMADGIKSEATAAVV